MHSVIGELYFYKLSVKRKEGCFPTLKEYIAGSIESFKKKHGYAPLYAIVREEENIGLDDLPLEIIPVANTLPPMHYRLHPVVKRKPVMNVYRRAYEG